MHVTRVQLTNWKNFPHADVRLQQRTFFPGSNAVGKSSLLDAFCFLHDVADHGVTHAVQRRGGLTQLRSLSAPRDAAIRLAVTIDDTWDYELELAAGKGFPVLVSRECVRKNGTVLLDRPDAADAQDRQRRTQTALEQVSANQDFRILATFFKSIVHRRILPQAVRDPHSFSPVPVTNDPFGRDFVRQIWQTPRRTREARLRRIEKALQTAIPTLSGLSIALDAGQPHLLVSFQHWRPGAMQDERSMSDGTLRLTALFWTLLEKGGPILWEEPELSLHEDIVCQLPGLFAMVSRGRQGRQVLVTTHSYALLSDPGIQPEEVLKLIPGQNGTSILPVSEDAARLMQHWKSAAVAVLPEISLNMD